MRLLKAFLVGITGLFIMITLLSLLITSKVRVSRAVTISNSSKQTIYQQTADLKNWANWHPMFKKGVAVIHYSRLTTGINATCDIVYHNKTTHLAIISADSSFVKFVLRSPGEIDIENEISFTPDKAANEITVQWKALTNVNWYPWEKFYAIFIDRITGPGYEDALNSLKSYIEGLK